MTHSRQGSTGVIRLLVAVFFAFSSLLVPIVAHSGDATAGTISYLHFMPTGVVLFSTSGIRSNPPSCASITNRFAINGTTPAGKLQVAGLLSAYSQGKQVVVFGTGGCPDWGDTESVNYFYLAS